MTFYFIRTLRIIHEANLRIVFRKMLNIERLKEFKKILEHPC